MPRSELPQGTVTFLFTDVEGSTQLLSELGDARYAEVLAEHRATVRGAVGRHAGVEVDSQGDAFFCAFAEAQDAVAAAVEARDLLAAGRVSVRMGLHTGPSVVTDEGYVGREVHRGARIAAAGYGGQILLSRETRERVQVEAADLGEHRLKDFADPVRLFQVGARRFPPLRTISNTNLRRPASSFVGRRNEVQAVLDRVHRGARLLALTGPGGSGKTRLAIEAGAELVETFTAGVFWVALASVRDPALVLDTVAKSLGAKGDLAEHIGPRELLLVIDNFEQVVEAAPALMALVESCPRLVVVVTSRESLRVRGEVEFPVLPLAQSEAVELFCERARVAPDATIVELCRRLDNLPLAVELAAAGTGVLSAAQILERLSQRLDLLKGGRDAETRQKTLRATIAWSYDLLGEAEKALFARLAVFVGGWSTEAAEAVCQASVDALQGLLEKNLIRRNGNRFAMLESIREYGLERLDEVGAADRLLALLGDHLIRTAKAEGSPMFLGRQQAAWARLDDEHANTRAVIEWAMRQQRLPCVFALIGSHFTFWIARGHLNEALPWVAGALRARSKVDDDSWTEMLVGAGEIYRMAGDATMAVALKEELLERYRSSEPADPITVPATLVNLSDLAMQAGDLVRARELAEQSLQLRIERGLNPARSIVTLGQIALRENDLGAAERLLEEAHRGFVVLQDENNAASTRAMLGNVALLRGDHSAAGDLLRESLRRAELLGNKQLLSDCLQELAVLARSQGELERAARLWGAGQALRRRSGIAPLIDEEMTALPAALQKEGAALSLEDAISLASSHDR